MEGLCYSLYIVAFKGRGDVQWPTVVKKFDLEYGSLLE